MSSRPASSAAIFKFNYELLIDKNELTRLDPYHLELSLEGRENFAETSNNHEDIPNQELITCTIFKVKYPLSAMKKLTSLLLIAMTGTVAIAQSTDLCQGKYYTEEVGAAKLNALQKRMTSLKAWQNYADSVRSKLKKGMEMEVFPTKTPLNPRFRNKKIMNGYTVESVVFESIPGFFVAGNLYKPTGTIANKALAGIICPHGHWDQPEDYGRYRHDMQLRCASFARMGAVVFSLEMIGYGESIQVNHEYQKGLLLQTWNGIRAIDFLLSLPETDPERIAVTGASGGGTQTFMVTVLDPRVKVSIPVVMVSSHFFGGCNCESGMPVHKDGNKVYSNVEIASLAAPRPMLLISDGKDWTKNTKKVEFPFVKSIYKLYGKEPLVENAHFENEEHDYGKSKRLAAYSFLAKYLGMKIAAIKDKDGKVNEDFISFLDRKDLTYFKPEELTSLIKEDEVYKVLKNLQAKK